MNALVKLGAVEYVRNLDLYHGRAGDGSQWKVEVDYNNSGNETGHYNLHDVSGLYVGSKNVAEEFSLARAGGKHVPETHKIVSLDADAVVFNANFSTSELNDEEKQAFYSAMKVLTSFTVSELDPLQFEYKDAWDIVVKKSNDVRKRLGINQISRKAEKIIIEELKQDKNIQKIFNFSTRSLNKCICDIISAFNTKIFLNYYPSYAIDSYLQGDKVIKYSDSNEEYLFNSKYVSAWCFNNHIVGYQQKVDSATLKKTIKMCHMFDTKKIMEEKQYGEMVQTMMQRYGELTLNLDNLINKETAEFLSSASSKEVMDFINQYPNCKELYDKSSYIFEGWSVGQHTQAVIEFFDKYYQDEVPTKLKSFMKILILAHDIGKAYSKEHNVSQKVGNLKEIHNVYEALNIKEPFTRLIEFITNDAQLFTSAILLKRGDKYSTFSRLIGACNQVFKEVFGRLPKKAEIKGLVSLCITLQACDSGSYTRYATIQEGNKFVTGVNDRFTASFKLNKRGNPRLIEFEDLLGKENMGEDLFNL